MVSNARPKHVRGPRHLSQPRHARHARVSKHVGAGPRVSWTKAGTSAIAIVVTLWALTSAMGSHASHDPRSNALASTFAESDLSAPSAEATVSTVAMPVVPGLAQAAIRQPASVGYAAVAWVGRAAPHVSGTVAEPAALQVTAIPRLASLSYQRAATVEAHDAPTCGISWEILAGIGLVESDHGRSGGSGNPSWSGVATPAILGPVLNGQGGFPVIKDTDHGVLDSDGLYDRAVGPMQFLPATWREYNPATSAANAPNPENISDAASAAARYLCASGVDLRTPAGLVDAVYGYNHSFAYVTNVVTAAQRYAEGTLQGASGALAELPALLSGQPTASFVTDSVVVPAGSTSPGTSSGSSAGGSPSGTSPATTRSAIVTLVPPASNPSVPAQGQTSAAPDPDSTASKTSASESPASESPAPGASTSGASTTESAAPSTSAADSSTPDTSAPDTPTLTPSLAPTPTVAPTRNPTPTPTYLNPDTDTDTDADTDGNAHGRIADDYT